MKTIVFENSLNETFNVMAEDERYIICSRIYKVEESKQEAEQWDKDLESKLKEHFEELIESEKENWNNNFEFWSINCINALKIEQEIKYLELGERPTEYEEDTQCYTIVDKKEKIRGADNYYTKFNYLDSKECKQALVELNNGKLEISRRNKVNLSEYKINEVK